MSKPGLASLKPPPAVQTVMRILLTGAGNPFGKAIVEALLRDGHHIRVFGDGPETIRGLDRLGTVAWYPGDLQVGGSIEPALSERQVIVHAAPCDEPGKDARQHAVKVERGSLYARYGAEREQVDHFIHVAPAEPERAWRTVQQNAVQAVQGMRGDIVTTFIPAKTPEQAARDVVAALKAKPLLGKQPGRETDAVTA